MDQEKVDNFIKEKADYFETEDLNELREFLLKSDDSKWQEIKNYHFINPYAIMYASVFAGFLGLDKYMMGETTLGLLKMITFGGFGVWLVVDWLLVMSDTRRKNLEIIVNLFETEQLEASISH